MRHRKAGFKLGRKTPHVALVAQPGHIHPHGRPCGNHCNKAKAVRPHVEKMITLGKKGDLHSRRQALSFMMTRESVTRLFDTVAPRYGDRNGGYLAHCSHRFPQGDGGETALIELLGAEQVLDEKRQKRAEAREKRREEMQAALAAGGPAPGTEGEEPQQS